MPPDASDAFPAAASSAAAPEGPPDKPQEKPLRSRHEAFCQYFVLYGNASYAACDAGYAGASSKNQGYRLMRQPRIRARIADIRRELARAYALDAQVLLGKLESLYQRANEDHHFHAAVRAVEAQARIAAMSQGRVKAFGPALTKGAAKGAAKGKDDR